MGLLCKSEWQDGAPGFERTWRVSGEWRKRNKEDQGGLLMENGSRLAVILAFLLVLVILEYVSLPCFYGK